MISILIPIYNQDVTVLVAALHNQASQQLIEFEIIAIEDGSSKFLGENATLQTLEFCSYRLLAQNIGRSAIRNKLADEAKYEHLLFLDCDTALPSSHFIEKYISFCKEQCVVLGGTIYDKKYLTKNNHLMFNYGASRERNDAKNRIRRCKSPMFTTPNFLITKTIFNKVRFDENIKGYGHEDTIFGIMLQKNHIEFYFIDNPVIHTGLEENSVFLQKTKKAIENLYALSSIQTYENLNEISRILITFKNIKNKKLVSIFSFLYSLLHVGIERILCSAYPPLLLFDIYKLLYLCKISHTK
ncbi:MAG: hypothetical protein AUK44_10495 [Porphyromonadaceae bacterium CG2_30_38_12]|nr:MAG: hypothetical protein AUK44_10495 [Porphyromonadaceae bacterium CG2_30_38_12]